MRILVVDDETDLRIAICHEMRAAGFAVDQAADLATADEMLAVNAYDCAVFDRMFRVNDPQHGHRTLDALDYVRSRRAVGLAVPVLFLTARDTLDDRVAGLRHGDDYLVKPFAMEELVVRVRSLCRRVAGEPTTGLVLRCGDLEINTARREVRRAGALLTLTTKEFDVLEQLVLEVGKPVSRTALIESCWDQWVQPKGNVVDQVIKQLRRKLRDPPMISAVPNVGYRIDPAPTPRTRR